MQSRLTTSFWVTTVSSEAFIRISAGSHPETSRFLASANRHTHFLWSSGLFESLEGGVKIGRVPFSCRSPLREMGQLPASPLGNWGLPSYKDSMLREQMIKSKPIFSVCLVLMRRIASSCSGIQDELEVSFYDSWDLVVEAKTPALPCGLTWLR